MLGSLFAGVGSSLLSQLFSGNEKDEAIALAGDSPMPSSRPPAPPIDEAVTDNPGPQEKSWWRRVNDVADEPIGGAVLNTLGSVYADKRAQRNANRARRELRSEGLTPWEAAGASGGGQGTSASGNTLGNGPPKRMSTQLEFQAEQAALERQNKKEIAEIGARAPGIHADLASKAAPLQRQKLRYENNVLRAQEAKLLAEYDQLDLQIRERWEMKLASMGVDNVLAALVIAREGLDIRKVLLGTSSNDPKEVAKIERVIPFIRGLGSKIYQEGYGLANVLSDAGEFVADKANDGVRNIRQNRVVPIEGLPRRPQNIGNNTPDRVN